MKEEKKYRRCVACGIFAVLFAEILICHECMKKLHQCPHSPEGERHIDMTAFISPSAAPVSGMTTLE